MKTSERVTRVFILIFCLGVVILPLALWMRTPLIHARIAESGGWSQDPIRARVGEPLRLKFTSDDVVHGFAVGQMDIQPVDIEPGKISEVTLTFDRPGVYTFFCTRWCGLNHWRMRGTIEVSGNNPVPPPANQPLYVKLGLNLDAPHLAPALPDKTPSAARGQKLADEPVISQFKSPDYYRAHSPAEVFEELHATGLDSATRWDLVAALWRSNTSEQALADGQNIFAQNCAACHGERGAGDGVFAAELAAAGQASTHSMNSASRAGTGTTSPRAGTGTTSQEMVMQTPANFSDPQRLLGASPALLQGKILRGGMGTGMPMWGSIFTEEQIWDVIAYLYSFQFDYSR